MRKYCVIGYPIDHSLSPKLHNNWFKNFGIDAEYVLEEVRAGELGEKIEYLTSKYNGFNVTYPLKKEIIPFLSQISPEAKELGSVNTVVVNHGKLEGYNTDIIGMKQILADINKDHYYILGNGNMAKTTVYALAAEKVTVICRNKEKAKKELNREYISYISYEQFKELNIKNSAIINTLPLTLDISEILIGKYNNTLLDCNYNNIYHYDIKEYINGLELLMAQGAQSFKIWTGKQPPTKLKN